MVEIRISTEISAASLKNESTPEKRVKYADEVEVKKPLKLLVPPVLGTDSTSCESQNQTPTSASSPLPKQGILKAPEKTKYNLWDDNQLASGGNSDGSRSSSSQRSRTESQTL